jgi:hypothetical protein
MFFARHPNGDILILPVGESEFLPLPLIDIR